MSSYARGLELVDALNDAGIFAVLDPRAATPPCVLVTPPRRTYDIACGYTAAWSLYALVPGVGNADAFKALDALVDDVAGVLPVLRADVTQYALTPDAPPLPAYHIELEEGI